MIFICRNIGYHAKFGDVNSDSKSLQGLRRLGGGGMKQNQVYNFVFPSKVKYKSTTLFMVLIYNLSSERVRGLRF